MTKTKGGCKTPPYLSQLMLSVLFPDKYLILQKAP